MTQQTATEPQQDVVRVQEQLLEMLRLAGTETPPPRREVVEKVIAAPSPTPDVKPSTAKVTVSSTPPAAGEECPKCYSMTPWGKSNWCPECGYYPKAGFEGTGIDVTEDDLPPSLLRVIPEWAFPTVLGAVAILVGSITTRFVFHDELQRSLCGISQLVVCSLTLIAVHCRAVYHATNSGKPIMVFMNPGETWSVVFHKMPQTKLLVLLLGWSMAGAVASLAVGVDVELVAHRVADEVKGKKKVTFADIVSATKSVGMKAFGGKAPSMDTITQIMQATDQLSGGGGGGSADGEIGTAIGDLAKTSEAISGDGPKKPLSNTVGDVTSASTHSSPTKTTPGSQSSTASTTGSAPSASPPGGESPAPTKIKETIDYWVYGYTTNSTGELRSLLLATTGGKGRLRYSQKLGVDHLSPDELTKMTEQLKAYRSKETTVDSPYGGKWIKPVVKCRVEHEGVSEDARPTNPMFQSVIIP